MTSAGQCRLAPLIPLILDSNQLYDFLVRIMFKLHGNLPNDVLQGHRDRFRAIFTQLKSFYGQARNLQYFVNLITVPKLPELAPNFDSKVDFGAYQAPVVSVAPETDQSDAASSVAGSEPPPELVSNLVEVQEPLIVATESVQRQRRAVSPAPPPAQQPKVNFEQIIRERDDLIQHLQMEVDRLGYAKLRYDLFRKLKFVFFFHI